NPDGNSCFISNMGDANVNDSEVIDCSIILEDNPLFSLDSQFESDDEKTKCEPLNDQVEEASSESLPSQNDEQPQLNCGSVPRPNLENLVPRAVHLETIGLTGSDSSPVVPVDVSSIYLHSPDELLEENFE